MFCMSGLKRKINNYVRALEKLNQGLVRYDGRDDLARDGVIQRFEFTFELVWKAQKVLFEIEGLIGLNSPKSVLREAYVANIIEDELVWLNMLKDRNLTSHIYDETTAVEISRRIQYEYLGAFQVLKQKLENRLRDNLDAE